MTDWWAKMNDEIALNSYTEPTISNIAAMVRAQNDLYMVTQEASKNLHGDNLEASLKEGTLTIAELRRCANNIISFLKTTHAQKRMDSKEDIKVEIINRIEAENITDPNEIVYYELGN